MSVCCQTAESWTGRNDIGARSTPVAVFAASSLCQWPLHSAAQLGLPNLGFPPDIPAGSSWQSAIAEFRFQASHGPGTLPSGSVLQFAHCSLRRTGPKTLFRSDFTSWPAKLSRRVICFNRNFRSDSLFNPQAVLIRLLYTRPKISRWG